VVKLKNIKRTLPVNDRKANHLLEGQPKKNNNKNIKKIKIKIKNAKNIASKVDKMYKNM